MSAGVVSTAASTTNSTYTVIKGIGAASTSTSAITTSIIASSPSGSASRSAPTNTKLSSSSLSHLYPDSKTLLVSSKRPRSFLERAARELLAGGTEFLILSGLGEAVGLCIRLMTILETKKAAACVKIYTKFTATNSLAATSLAGLPKTISNHKFHSKDAVIKPSTYADDIDASTTSPPSPPSPQLTAAPSAATTSTNTLPTAAAAKAYVQYSPGIEIVLRRHPFFKGSRISPGYISFVSSSDEASSNSGFGETGSQSFSSVYVKAPRDRQASVNAGDVALYVGGGGINKAFASILSECDQEVDKYQRLHKELLKKAVDENADKKRDEDVVSVQLNNVSVIHPDVQLGLCRPCRALQAKGDECGATFISVFKQNKAPYMDEKNMAMVYVVGPKGTDFASKTEFLDAVKATGLNMMTTMCDYNGIARRSLSKSVLRISTCRICLVSGGVYKHADASKLEVAQALLKGLDDGYRHGPAPRLLFPSTEEAFKQAWIKETGSEIADASTDSDSR